METLDELLVALGFDYDDEGLDEFRKGIDRTLSAVKFLTTGLAALSAATSALLITTNAATDEQGKLSDEMDISIGKIDALSRSMKLAGDDANSLRSSLTGISKAASEAARGSGSGVEAFGLLGINLESVNGELKDSFQLIMEVSGAMQGMRAAQQIELAEKLGLGGMIRLLQQGPDAIQDLLSEMEALGVATEEDAKIAAEFNDALTMLRAIIADISRTISRILSPAITENINKFKEWWKLNRDIVQLKIDEYITNVTFAIRLLTIAVGAFIALRLVSHLLQLVNLMRKLTVATLLFNAVALAIPALIAGAILGLTLIVQDLWTAFKGGDSVIGDLMEQFPQFASEIQLLIDIVGEFITVMGKLGEMVLEGWKEIFDLFENISFEKFKQFLKDIPGFVKFLGTGEVGDPTANLTSPINNNNLTNNNSSTSNTFGDININVQGASSPVETANVIGEQLSQSIQELYSPVIA